MVIAKQEIRLRRNQRMSDRIYFTTWGKDLKKLPKNIPTYAMRRSKLNETTLESVVRAIESWTGLIAYPVKEIGSKEKEGAQHNQYQLTLCKRLRGGYVPQAEIWISILMAET